MSDKQDLDEYVGERFDQEYENLPLRQSVVTQCDFCDNQATQTDETGEEIIILFCDECAELGQEKLESMWRDLEE